LKKARKESGNKKERNRKIQIKGSYKRKMRGRDKKTNNGERKKQRREHRKFIEEGREYNKKFWEELMACFHLMLHGPHRKPKN
jgi:hypothetical protein